MKIILIVVVVMSVLTGLFQGCVNALFGKDSFTDGFLEHTSYLIIIGVFVVFFGIIIFLFGGGKNNY